MNVVTLTVLMIVAVLCLAAGYFIARSREAAIKTRLREEKEELQAELIQKEDTLKHMTSTQHEVQTELGTATQQLAGESERSAQQASDLTRLQNRLDELQNTLAERERELSSAQASLRSSQEQVREQETHYQQLREQFQQ